MKGLPKYNSVQMEMEGQPTEPSVSVDTQALADVYMAAAGFLQVMDLLEKQSGLEHWQQARSVLLRSLDNVKARLAEVSLIVRP